MTTTEVTGLINDQRYEVVPIDLLEPHPANPNVGDRAAIAESIAVSGFYGSTLVRELSPGRYQILAGEHRWRELIEAGSTEIPVIIVEAEDDVKALRILLADNETARRARYKPDVLAQVLSSLGSLEGTGFELDALQKLEEERIPAPGEDELTDGETGGDGEREFVREYGIVVTFEDEEAQAGFYDWLLEHGGLEAHQIRVVSI